MWPRVSTLGLHMHSSLHTLLISTPLFEIDVLNTKLRRKHRSEFDKNGFESEYDDLRKKIYFRLLNTSR